MDSLQEIKKPAGPLLHPLSAGQMLDRSFRLYRQNFLHFVAIIAPIQIVSSLLLLVQTVNNAAVAAVGTLLGTLVTYLLAFFGMAALITAAFNTYTGTRLTIGEVYRLTQEKFGTLVLGLLAAMVAGIAIFVWWFAGIIVGWLSGLGMIMFFAACIAPLFVIIMLLENKDGFQALRRAWDLTRRRFWPTLGYAFLVYILAQTIVLGPVLVAAAVGVITFGEQSDWPIIIQAFASLIVGILYTPFQVIAYMMLYFDLRVRTEGLDIELQAAQQQESASFQQVLALAPQPEQGNWMTGAEYGYFVLLSFGFLALFVALGALIGLGSFMAATAVGGF